MDSISPVLTELEVPVEQVVALGQDEFYPIVVARVVFADGQLGSYTRQSGSQSSSCDLSPECGEQRDTLGQCDQS
jgi:hypothetical protein